MHHRQEIMIRHHISLFPIVFKIFCKWFETPDWPGGQYLWGLQVRHHVEEVVAQEHPPLCQEDSEADGVPHDTCLPLRQLTVIIGISWQNRGDEMKHLRNKHLDQNKTLKKRMNDKAGLLTDIIIFDGAEHAEGLN